MIAIDSNEMSLQWGSSQVVHMSALREDAGLVSFQPAPVFNQFKLNAQWIISVCAAGMARSELDVRVQHLQDGSDVLTIVGESQPRAIGGNHVFAYQRFEKHVKIPQEVSADSMGIHFADGILLVCFQRTEI